MQKDVLVELSKSDEGSRSDLEVISDVLNGRSDYFEILVSRYQDKVFRLCVSMLSNQILAEDAVQEIFVKAYVGLGKFRKDSSFSTWLYRISSNHCLDIIRKLKKRKESSWDQMVENHGDKITQLLVSPDKHADSIANRQLIEQVMDSINPEYKLILTLREVNRMSYDDIGTTLDLTLNAVKSRLRRARQDFEHKLRHFFPNASM